MSRSAVWSPSQRDADVALYDVGCDLVQAAVAISRGVRNPEAAPAIPAVLGCIEAALDELSCASAALPPTRAQSRPAGADQKGQAVADRLAQGCTNLTVALEDARAASRAARALAARSLAGNS